MIDPRRVDLRLMWRLLLRPQSTSTAISRQLVVALGFALIVLASCGGSGGVATTDGVAEPAAEQLVAVEPIAAAEPIAVAEPTAVSTASAVAEPTAVPVVGYDAPGGLVVPDPLAPGAPGQFIASEPFMLRSQNGLSMEGQRLLYHSQSAAGDDVAVSGFVVYPAGSPPAGGWPLIAWAHGTTGIADTCAPSNSPVNVTNMIPARLVAEGFAVVATDYEGLGTPGRHPYIVGASQAHSVLDSVRAVHQMGLPVSDQWIAFGHSQGGHAAMFTAQLQQSYAPELELIGTIASAPPSQFSTLISSLIGSDYQGYLPMAIAGQAAAFSEIDLATVLTPEAASLLDVIDTGCVLDIFDVFNPLPWEDTVMQPDLLASGPLADRLREQDTNRLPTREPLLIIHGAADEQIPVETSAVLMDQLCAFEGQGPAVRNVYPGGTHSGPVYGEAAWPDLLEWVEARFGGEVASDDCQR